MNSAQPDVPNELRVVDDPGCQQMVGYRTEVFPSEGICRVKLDIEPRHLNKVGILHGGIVAMLLDVVCGNVAAIHFDPAGRSRLVTVSLNTNFVGATNEGRVEATASVTGGGKTLCHVAGELQDEAGKTLATATGVFRRISV
ncbi:PaaI family thioesterase [Primorskyibacter sp. S87]|uniref:PaaI family thioesterase n=1 Tax=Primorskyibacter sp. S87 TaxID=3415126 RepID=UPI003C7AAA69